MNFKKKNWFLPNESIGFYQLLKSKEIKHLESLFDSAVTDQAFDLHAVKG